MVFRTRPRMTEEAGMRRRTKCFIFLVFVVVISLGCYSWNYRSEHIILENNYRRVIAQGKKYAAAYVKCDRNLRTSKSNLDNIQKSNTQMQTKLATQEKEIAELDTTNNEAHMKLQQAYQFYLDTKDLIGNDQSVSEDLSVSPDAAEALKKEITNLKADKEGYERLKTAHASTLQALEDVKKTNEDHITRTSDLEDQQRKTTKQNKVLKKMKKDLIEELDKKNMLIKSLAYKVKMKETKHASEEMSKSLQETMKHLKQAPANNENMEISAITKIPITTAAPKQSPVAAPKQAPVDATKQESPDAPKQEIETEKRIDQEDDLRVIKINPEKNKITNNNNKVQTNLPISRSPAHPAAEHGHALNLKEATNKEESEEDDFAEGDDNDNFN